MPYIDTKTNLPVEKQTADRLKTQMGKLIECFPGKSENWLMTAVEGNVMMTFRGEEEPAVFADVSVFGDLKKEDCALFAEKMTETYCEILGVRPDRVYIKFNGSKTWSWNGRMF